MHKITVYSELKNMDLHAVSAYEAITTLLGVSELRALYKVTRWDIVSPKATKEDALADVKKILNDTYYIINPNKESWRLEDNAIGEEGASKQIRIEVAEKESMNLTAVIEKIERKINVPILSIHKKIIWDLRFNKDTALTQQDIEKKIIKTTSTTQGILVHPLYEVFSYV